MLIRTIYFILQEKLKDDYVKGLSGVLEPLSKFLGKGNFFASPDKVTEKTNFIYRKFVFLYFLEQFKILYFYSFTIFLIPYLKKVRIGKIEKVI